MLNVLLESRARRTRRTRSMVVSVLGHALLITLAVAMRASGTERAAAEPPATAPVYVESRPTAPVTGPVTTASAVPQTPTMRFPAPILVPVDVQAGIPPVDVNVKPSDLFENLGNPSAGVAGSGAPGASPGTGVYHAEQVERSVLPNAGNPLPRFPEVLRAGGVEGRVLVQFVVDTTGRVEPGSIRFIASSHDLYEAAVRGVLPRYRFQAAEVGGRKVRQLVQMPFGFTLAR